MPRVEVKLGDIDVVIVDTEMGEDKMQKLRTMWVLAAGVRRGSIYNYVRK